MSTLLTLPGLIDCHVHFREPGYEQKETMKTGALAARSGGILTVCDMPNTNPPVVTAEAFEEKIKLAEQISDCDIRIFFGATQREHLLAFREIWGSERCCGLKVFFDHSTGDQGANREVIEEAFELCAELSAPLVAHCEDAVMNAAALEKNTKETIEAHSEMRSVQSEEKAVKDAIDLARTHGTHLHVAHLSTAGGLRAIRDAKDEGLNVTCEVTPHHLFLSTADYKTLGTLAKMNPPLRLTEDCKALWSELGRTIDCIATDHAPHTLQEKRTGPPLSAPSGVPEIQTMLPLLLTVVSGGWPHPAGKPFNVSLTMEQIEELCFTNPNNIFNLGASDEPRVTIDPEEEWEIRASDLHSKCGWTPYEGWKVRGRVKKIL